MSENTNTLNVVSNDLLPINLSHAKIGNEDEEKTLGEYEDSEIPGNTNISIKSSSDVVIGNVTQFHGPVTIYQNATNNSQIEKKTINPENNISNNQNSKIYEANNGTNSQTKLVASETLTRKPLSKFSDTLITKKAFVWTCIVIALIFICISVTLGLYLQGNLNQDASSDSDKEKHKMLSRSVWGGRPPLYTRKIHQPTKYVIISHTASAFCQSIETCSRIVAQIQSQHAAEYDSPDIGYNFLIGGDENIYIGRGWDAENFHCENSIGISFIGNFISDRVTRGMQEATLQLLQSGWKQKKLDENYKLISHNQTGNTLSPGVNVYNIIRFWPHYTSELLPITP